MDYPVKIKTKSIGGMTEEQFFKFCQENYLIKLERNTNGEIIIMAPTGSESALFNSSIATELGIWNKEHKLGYTFDSNAAFTLPNNAVRSPDAAFIRKEKWLNISNEDRKKFAHVCPDFVIELLSPSDNIIELEEKMKEWIDNGCLLGWLIDPNEKKTKVYRRGTTPVVKDFNQLLEGEDVLPGFKLDVQSIFH